jgi:hypothetical protein
MRFLFAAPPGVQNEVPELVNSLCGEEVARVHSVGSCSECCVFFWIIFLQLLYCIIVATLG